MARIRTIKPEFFTSEDIVSLSPLARLLFVALWCESDREGRLEWRPNTYKIRYLPVDNCSIEDLCRELIAQGLIRQYNGNYAYIPKFTKHQHINPREQASKLPAPTDIDASSTRDPRVSTRANLDVHVQGGREGNGTKPPCSPPLTTRGTRLKPDWEPDPDLIDWCLHQYGCTPKELVEVVPKFVDYWQAQPGAKGVKLNWDATFRNWIRKEYPK